ncbi:MAG TPA: hypothetical protein VKW08_06375 [Xanthobacteraceae bacterium]|nr:hypothetical protein [Xanthobacteraceae bacterium]
MADPVAAAMVATWLSPTGDAVNVPIFISYSSKEQKIAGDDLPRAGDAKHDHRIACPMSAAMEQTISGEKRSRARRPRSRRRRTWCRRGNAPS